MPTQNVYFFVEKIPIDYAGSTNHKESNRGGSRSTPFRQQAELNRNFAENRCVYDVPYFITGHRNLKNFYPDEMGSLV